MQLARIDSPSLAEGALAALVSTELAQLGWQIENDRSGPSTGNVMARLGGNRSTPTLLFSAHLDVIQPCVGVRPRLVDGWITSDGTTVLGADCKAGVAALIEAAHALRDDRRQHECGPLEILFTWGEEVGHQGAKALRGSWTQARYGFVLDGLVPVGTIIVAAPSYEAFSVRIQGLGAHAGVEPDKGRSAIVAAAHAIARLSWGRLDNFTTRNIGTISGGSARNAVPEIAELEGEIRSHDPGALAASTEAIRDAFRASCDAAGVDLSMDLRRIYDGYRLENDSEVVALASAGATATGQTAKAIASGGGSDANEFNRNGLPSCVLGIGAEQCHSVRERIAVTELERLANWVLGITRAVSRR